MSELIQNQARRREVLKHIIRQLHEGRTPDELKAQFGALLDDVGASEIAALESELIAEGLPEGEVKRLCDVHVAVFEDSLTQQTPPEMQAGHPIHTFRQENAALGQVIEAMKAQAEAAGAGEESAFEALRAGLGRLREVEKHYLREENLLFPYLEKQGIKGPPSVMWTLHDDVRAALRKLPALWEQGAVGRREWLLAVRAALETAGSLIPKEENILFPMSLETLQEAEWAAIQAGSDEIGYCLIEPGRGWRPTVAPAAVLEAPPAGLQPEADPLLRLGTGALRGSEWTLLLNHLPIDITFVDKDDTVRYFSQGPERIFVRTEAIIGRKVQNCHPPASVHVVTRILDDFKAGRRDVAEFWLNVMGKFVHIRYFAVRDAAGAYIGTMEVTQDIAPLRALEGERRLLDG